MRLISLMLSELKKTIANIVDPGNTLYFSGCLTHFTLPYIENKYKKILNNLNIDYITIPKFYCCGSPVINAGYIEDFEKLKNKQIELFKSYGIKKIITNCPSCAYMFNSNFSNTVKAYHITQILAKNLSKINRIHNNKEITYHDPCHLGRKSQITEEPRIILETLGFKVIDFQNSKENTSCCGAGGGLKTNNPKLSNSIAKDLLKQVKTKQLVTTCPMCYKHFTENAPKNLKIIELSELFK